MASTRKDPKGRVLRKGETYRTNDRRYAYTYTDPFGKRRSVYANDIMKLREKEDEIKRNQLDGIGIYADGKATLNDTFDRYLTLKKNIRNTTRAGYEYMYNQFVRKGFGEKKIKDIKYSDVKFFYNYLIEEKHLSIRTVDNVHVLLHPTFQMAVRDSIIRINPSDGVMAELKKNIGKNAGVREALTVPEQKAFLEFVREHPVYSKWYEVFVVLLGTGMRVGELCGLRWEDLDFENREISVNHTLVYDYIRSKKGDGEAYSISKPKTAAGIRTIPMLNSVYDAFVSVKEYQTKNGFNKTVIDGYTGFVFKNKYGNCLSGQNINEAIERITADYNNIEEIESRREKREALLLPKFSCHVLRHTFCTRLCENESNLKVIQIIMGHSQIETSLNIYAHVTESKKKESFANLSNKLDVL